MAKLAEILKESRQRKNLSIRDVAKLAKISSPYFSQLENGHNDKPSYQILINLSRILDFDIGEIEGYQKDERTSSLLDENKRLREALEYYANTEHYEPYCIPMGDYASDVTEDNGEIARQALEGGEIK